MTPMGLGLGLGLGSRQGISAGKPATWIVTDASGTGFIRMNVTETIIMSVTGTVQLRNGSTGDFQAGNFTFANGQKDIYFIGTGTITFSDRTKVSSLILSSTETTLSGSITGMALTYLYLRSTSTSITGSINGMALTFMYLLGTSTSITGSIAGMALTYLYLNDTSTAIVSSGTVGYNTRSLTGFSANNSLLFESVAFAGQGIIPTVTFVTGGNDKVLGVTVDGVNITVQLATDAMGVITTTAAQLKAAYDIVTAATALASCTLIGDGSGLVIAMTQKTLASPFGVTTEIRLLGTSVMTAVQYRYLFIQAAAATWGGSKAFQLTSGTSPGYNDGESQPQCITAYQELVGKSVVITLPAGWKGAVYPNDFPA